MLTTLLKLLLFFAAAAPWKASAYQKCGRSIYLTHSFDKRIVNGTDARPHEFPWIVSLQLPPSQHKCAGTIIDDTTILTAAHCIPTYWYRYSVVAGKHVLSKTERTEQTVKVAKVRIHPKYNTSVPYPLNDIAIIKLESPLNLNSPYVSRVCLPRWKQTFGGLCTVIGWGAKREGGLRSDVLQKVSVPLVSDKDCSYSYPGYLIESHLCAGYVEGGKDSCQGDSGGSLLCKGRDGKQYLAGIISCGKGCGRPYLYGIYTEVSHYTDWIATNIY